MPGEIDLFSLLVPGLLPILAGCVLVFVVLDLVLARLPSKANASPASTRMEIPPPKHSTKSSTPPGASSFRA